jgi:hypothetical protein
MAATVHPSQFLRSDRDSFGLNQASGESTMPDQRDGRVPRVGVIGAGWGARVQVYTSIN